MAGAEVVAEIGAVAGAGVEAEDGAGAVAGTGAETVDVSVAGSEAGEGAAASDAGAERRTGSGAECENVRGLGDGFEVGKGPSCSQNPTGLVM